MDYVLEHENDLKREEEGGGSSGLLLLLRGGAMGRGGPVWGVIRGMIRGREAPWGMRIRPSTSVRKL